MNHIHLNYPKTKDEWWGNVDKAWDQLRGIMNMFLDMNSYLGDGVGFPGDLTLAQHIENLKLKRDRELARHLSHAWFAAPDEPSIHDIPGWSVLCDLCSEEYILDEMKGESL